MVEEIEFGAGLSKADKQEALGVGKVEPNTEAQQKKRCQKPAQDEQDVPHTP